MAPTERERQLKFLNLTDRDVELLQGLRPLFDQHLDAVLDAFNEHLLAIPETQRLLRDHTTVVRLKQLQRDYLMGLTAGRFDQQYFEQRYRIGQTHERVGLAPRWYLLAYSRQFALIVPLIHEAFAGEPDRVRDTVLALQKVFMLDASLAMDAYISSDRYRHVQQLESIVEDSADIIFALDAEGRFRTWNQTAEQIFGWRTEEVLGQHFSTIVPPELLEAGELRRLEEQISAHGHYHSETQRLAKDGRRVPVEVTVSVLRDPQGNAIGRSAILRDITERKRLEEAKLQAERLAVIGAMAAKLAHEIRNPLSSITLNIDLVRDEVAELSKDGAPRGDEARSLLQSIDSEVRRIQRVTEDYLAFAKLPKARHEPVSINELLAQGLSFLQSLFDASKVELRTDFEPQVPQVFADESQLWQAILNLIRNAIEAMPAGGMLSLRTARVPGGVELRIGDTGKGMTEDERRQIFKPFFSTKTGGTGLGLPLTQQIITEHGGQIECETAVGKGTTFVIRLTRIEET